MQQISSKFKLFILKRHYLRQIDMQNCWWCAYNSTWGRRDRRVTTIVYGTCQT